MEVIKRETHIVDATGQVLGRLATQVAVLLRGKNKVGFAPYKDIGDFVTVKNVEGIKYTGKKFKEKKSIKKEAKPVKEKLVVKKVEEVVIKPVVRVEVKDELDDVLPEDFPTEKELASKPDRYFEAIGRRKTAVARVRLFTRGEK